MTTTRTTTALAALWMCAYLQNWHRWLLLHGPVQRRRERAGSVGLVQEVQFLLQGGQRMRNYQSVWLLHGLRLWRWMCAYLQNWHRWLLLHGPVQRRRERAGSVG